MRLFQSNTVVSDGKEYFAELRRDGERTQVMFSGLRDHIVGPSQMLRVRNQSQLLPKCFQWLIEYEDSLFLPLQALGMCAESAQEGLPLSDRRVDAGDWSTSGSCWKAMRALTWQRALPRHLWNPIGKP